MSLHRSISPDRTTGIEKTDPERNADFLDDGLVSLMPMQAEIWEPGDAGSTPGTAARVSLGDNFNGSIASPGDADWVAVNLVAGQKHVFSVWGRDGANLGLQDSVLQLYDGSGNRIPNAGNDDIAPGGNTFSLVRFTAITTGTYYVQVTGFGSHTGYYTLQTATDVFTPEQVADHMTHFAWGLPTPFRFDESPGGTIMVNLAGLTAEGRTLALWALESWSITTGINFVTTASPTADIMFDDNRPGAFAGPLSINPDTGINSQSSVNVGTAWLQSYGATIDSYSFQTYLHEIGHALGLGHSGPYDGVATYGVDNVYANDSTQMTVMSYFSLSENTTLPGGAYAVISPMVADVIAVSDLYGTASVYAGNTVWGANSNVGGWLGDLFAIVFDGAPARPGFYGGGPLTLTIHDTGGTDTLNLGTDTNDQRIDLRVGGISDIAGAQGNLVISAGSVIENVVGGSGNDLIIGNAVGNRMTGGRGNDTLLGGGGVDTAVYSGLSRADLTVVRNPNGTHTVTSAHGTDILGDIERIAVSDGTFTVTAMVTGPGRPSIDTVRHPTPQPEPTPLIAPVPPVGPVRLPDPFPTNGNDLLVGGSGPDQIDGLAGNDVIFGFGGDDGLKGGDGNDALYGGDGDDRLPGANGDDSLFGGAGNDRLGGGNGNDLMVGGAGNDTGGGGAGDDLIFAGAGDDIFSGGAGSDTLQGDAGHDRLAGSFGDDTVIGGAGNDSLGGGFGRDLMSGGDGDDEIGAGSFDDTVYGGAGNDFLGGGDGDDQLFGGAGADTLNGGYGNDYLSGGSGADVFVFNSFGGGGIDIVADFEDSIDRLRLVGQPLPPGDPLSGLVFTDTTYGGTIATVVDFADFRIVLVGITSASLTEDDFLFV